MDAETESVENKREKLAVFSKVIGPLTLLSYPAGTLEILQNAEKLAQELGDEYSLFMIHRGLSQYHTFAGGNPSLGLEYAEKCFNSSEKIKDFGLMAQSAVAVCMTYWSTGDYAKVVDIGGKAMQLIEENHLEKDLFGVGYSPYSTICNFYGASLGYMGRFKEANSALEKGLRNACAVNDKLSMAVAHMFHATVAHLAGYGDDTITHAQEAIKIYEEAEISLGLEAAWFLLGAGYYLRGDYGKAIDAGEKSLKLAKECGVPFNASWSYLCLAMTLRDTGDQKRALECAAEALRISQECNSKACEVLSRALLGCMVAEMTPAIIEDTEKQIRDGISILEDRKIKAPSTPVYLFLGEFLAKAGRKEEAIESLKKAESLYEEMEVGSESFWLTRTKEALKKLGSAAGSTQ